MAKQSLTTIKNWFKSTLKPTQAQFWDTWDSFFHKDEKIPSASVEGLDETLTSKASTELVNYLRNEVENFIDDLAAKLDRGSYTGSAQDLSNAIQNVLAVLASDDTTLDELQEIVNYIKQNKQVLESLGISNIAGLQDALNGKVDKVAGKQLTTEDFTTLLKLKLDAIDMTAKLDRAGYTGTAKDLSNAIQNILAVLASDDTTLDELQEIVNYIKQNKQVLETLGISNIAGLQDALNKTVTTEDTLTDSYLLSGGGEKKAKKSPVYVEGTGSKTLRGVRYIRFDGDYIVQIGQSLDGNGILYSDQDFVFESGSGNKVTLNQDGTLNIDKNIRQASGAAVGKIMTSDTSGNAIWKGAETIALTGNEIDMSAGDVFTKTLTADTTITITNAIVGKSVLFVVTGGGYGLTLPGTNISSKSYSRTDVNRIRITCESDISLIYEILSVKDTNIYVERGGTVDVSAGTHFVLNSGGTGANEYTIANINYNKTIYLHCYNSITDLVLIVNGVRRNVGNIPWVGLKTVGAIELTLVLRGEEIRVLSPEISMPYQVDNTINLVFTNGANGTNGNYCGVFAESDYDMSVDYSNSGGRVKCGNTISRRFNKYLDQGSVKLYTQGVRTIAFKDDSGNSLGIGLSELTLNYQYVLQILDLDGVGEHLYAFNAQNSIIDLSTYINLQYFRMSSSCFINSIVLTNCTKIRRMFVSNQNVTSVVFPASHDANYDFRAEISANLSSTVVNAMLAMMRNWPAPESYSDFEKTVIFGVGTATPTGQGLTDKAALIAAGWNVVTN